MKYLFILLGALLPAAHALAQAEHPLNPLGDTSGGGPELYGRILRFLVGFTGIGGLFFFIWGGIVLLTSRGNPDRVKSGRDTLMWATIGIVAVFSSYVVLRFIIQTVITRENV